MSMARKRQLAGPLLLLLGASAAHGFSLCNGPLLARGRATMTTSCVDQPWRLRRGARGERSAPLVMQERKEDGTARDSKWADTTPVLDEAAERVESVKAGVLSAVAGSVAMAPLAVTVTTAWFPSNAFDAQWELSHDGLAVMLGLFGLVYRYGQLLAHNCHVGFSCCKEPWLTKLCRTSKCSGAEGPQSTAQAGRCGGIRHHAHASHASGRVCTHSTSWLTRSRAGALILSALSGSDNALHVTYSHASLVSPHNALTGKCAHLSAFSGLTR